MVPDKDSADEHPPRPNRLLSPWTYSQWRIVHLVAVDWFSSLETTCVIRVANRPECQRCCESSTQLHRLVKPNRMGFGESTSSLDLSGGLGSRGWIGSSWRLPAGRSSGCWLAWSGSASPVRNCQPGRKTWSSDVFWSLRDVMEVEPPLFVEENLFSKGPFSTSMLVPGRVDS